jgi:uncharacterized protein (TIGR01777 family)
MTTLIIGATGFIGRELMKELHTGGHQPVAISRNAMKAREILGREVEIREWSGHDPEGLAGYITDDTAIVNLAGESIAAGRWSEKRMGLITDSRVRTGQLITEALRFSQCRPAALIQGSATGYYGARVEERTDETGPAGTGFLAELTKKWEESVQDAGKYTRRVVMIRTGLVLGNHGGLLEKMLLPFRFYSGTVLGSGKQWLPWIHIKDQARAISFLLSNSHCNGAYNLTAPNPVRMAEFIRLLGKSTGKPAWMKIPGFFLKAALGKMAEETILASQHILPEKLVGEGFVFNYPWLDQTFENLLNSK